MPTPIEPVHAAAFWQWFVDHEDHLFTLATTGTASPADLNNALRRVHPKLSVEIGPGQAGRRELIISAGGHGPAFPAVHALADAAPDLVRWTVTRFRPRRPLVEPMQYGSLILRPDQVWARAYPTVGRIDVALYVEGYSETPDQRLEQVAFLMLEHVLGEVDLETTIGRITCMALPKRGRATLVPLADLPPIVDRIFGR